jgi:hypothetical protein
LKQSTIRGGRLKGIPLRWNNLPERWNNGIMDNPLKSQPDFQGIQDSNIPTSFSSDVF